MDRLQTKKTKKRSFFVRAIQAATVMFGIAALVAAPHMAEAHHGPKASRNPKKLWEHKPPKHKPLPKHSILPINTFIKKVLHHGEGGGHGGFHGGGKGHGGAGNCEGC
jgi:hypothetical protein